MPTQEQAEKAWKHGNKGKQYYDAMTEEQKKAMWQYGYDRKLINTSTLGPGAKAEYQKYVNPNKPEYAMQASIVEKNPKQYIQTQNEKVMAAITPSIVKNMAKQTPEQIATPKSEIPRVLTAAEKRRLLNEENIEALTPQEKLVTTGKAGLTKIPTNNNKMIPVGKAGLVKTQAREFNGIDAALLGALDSTTLGAMNIRDDAAIQANKGAFTAGQVAGYIAPGAGLTNAAGKGLAKLGAGKLAQNLGGGALAGATIDTGQGLVAGDTGKELLGRVGRGALIGLAADGALIGLGAAGKAIMKKLANKQTLSAAEKAVVDKLPEPAKKEITLYVDSYGNVKNTPEPTLLLGEGKTVTPEIPKRQIEAPFKITQAEKAKLTKLDAFKSPTNDFETQGNINAQLEIKTQPQAQSNTDTINKIAFEPNKNKKTLKGNLETGYSKVVNNQFELSKVSKGQDASTNAKVMASNARNAKGTVEYIVNNKLVDKGGREIGQSLNDVFTVPKGKEREFEDYLLHKHNIQRMEQGKPVFGEDVTRETSKAKVDTYEMMNPEFKQKSEELNNFMTTLTKTWGDDLIPPELMNKIQKIYPNYVPTWRESIATGGGNYKSKGITPGQLVKSAIGGDEQIVSLSRSIPALINKTVKSARKNEVYLSILDAIEKDADGMKAFAKLTDGKPGEAELISEAIQKEGIDGIVNREMLVADPQKGYFVTAMRKGKPVRMEITKDMYDALKSLDEVDMNDAGKVIDVFKKYTVDLFKGLTTGYNPVFAIRNVFRDIPTAYVYGTENNPVKFATNLYRAGKKIVNKDALYKEYLALGGERSNFFEINKGIRNQGNLGKVEKKLSAFNNLTETLPRFAEFMNTVEKGGGTYDSKMQGLFNAAEITVNFGRSGNITKSVDKFVPYLNPSVQGIDRFVRAMRNPASVAKALGILTLPTAGLYAINQTVAKEEYDKLNNRTKDTYYVIPTGEGTFFKVPKSREIGVLFSTLFERLARQYQGDKKAFKGMGETLLTNFAPVNPIESNIIAPATLNLKSNKDFANRDIVPQYMREDNRSPYLQFDEKTSEIAKALGKAINASPKQIDYLIKSYTGIVGSILQPATTKGGSVAKNIITRNFIADPLYSNEIQNEFYETRDALKRIATDKNLNLKLNSKLVTPEETLRGKYDAAAKEMSAIRKEISKVQASNDLNKEQKMRDLQAKILKIAQDTLDKYPLKK
jgi:hypothetical protein